MYVGKVYWLFDAERVFGGYWATFVRVCCFRALTFDPNCLMSLLTKVAKFSVTAVYLSFDRMLAKFCKAVCL